jgi:hypothetical protein
MLRPFTVAAALPFAMFGLFVASFEREKRGGGGGERGEEEEKRREEERRRRKGKKKRRKGEKASMKGNTTQ